MHDTEPVYMMVLADGWASTGKCRKNSMHAVSRSREFMEDTGLPSYYWHTESHHDTSTSRGIAAEAEKSLLRRSYDARLSLKVYCCTVYLSVMAFGNMKPHKGVIPSLSLLPLQDPSVPDGKTFFDAIQFN
jgi:hypothetical protein